MAGCCFLVLAVTVFGRAFTDCDGLGDDLALRSPHVVVGHVLHLLAARDELAHVVGRPGGVDGAALVHDVVDFLAAGEDDHGPRANLERVDWSVFPSPFQKSGEMSISTRYQRGRAKRASHCLWMPLIGIWWMFPRIGMVGGPGGRPGSRRPTRESLYSPKVTTTAKVASTTGLEKIPMLAVVKGVGTTKVASTLHAGKAHI